MHVDNCTVSTGFISPTAFEEAQELFLAGEIPSNFSVNKVLQTFTIESLHNCFVDIDAYNEIVNKELDLYELEYCEAVLLGVLELIHHDT